jgi:hypothetical protein
MESLYAPPTNQIVAGLLAVAGSLAALRGARLVGRGLRHARPLDLVRGIRLWVLALVAGVFAVGLLSAQAGFLILGAIILGEELYETGLLAVIIRSGERRSAEWPPGPRTPSGAGELPGESQASGGGRVRPGPAIFPRDDRSRASRRFRMPPG